MLRSKICIAVTKSIGTLKLHPDKPDIISEIKKTLQNVKCPKTKSYHWNLREN